MPTTTTLRKAREDARGGKKPSTQAGEFVREEMHRLRQGDANVRSRRQAIAIGLSEARRAGVKLGMPKQGKAAAGVRRRAQRDRAVGAGTLKPSPRRSAGARKAAKSRRRRAAG